MHRFVSIFLLALLSALLLTLRSPHNFGQECVLHCASLRQAQERVTTTCTDGSGVLSCLHTHTRATRLRRSPLIHIAAVRVHPARFNLQLWRAFWSEGHARFIPQTAAKSDAPEPPLAPHSFGVESPPIGGTASRPRTIVVPPWCRPRRKGGQRWISLRRLPHAGGNHQRVVRHVSQVVRCESVHFLSCQVRFDCSVIRQPRVSVGLKSSCARPPTLPPASSFVAVTAPWTCR